MSESLSGRVVDILSQASRPMSALEIAHSVGMKTRKQINPTLYELEKKSKIKKVCEIPALWSLICTSGAAQSIHMEHVSPGGVEGQVLGFLSGVGKPCTALEIAKAVGYKTRKEINPLLHAMAKDGLVVKDESKGAPQWSVVCCEQHSAGLDTLARPPAVQHTSVGLPVTTHVETAPMETENLEGQVLAVLTSKPGVGQTALEIARGIGVNATRSVVNYALENLKREGKVRCFRTKPEQWLAELESTQPLSGTSSSTYVGDLTRNPVSALSEYCQKNHLELTFPVIEEYGPPNRKTFVTAVVFGDKQFKVESSKKKDGKRLAADLALQSIRFGVSPPSAPPQQQAGPSQSVTFCDRVHAISHTKFLELQQSIQTPQPGRKVIAAFVMEDKGTGGMTVISIGSGTQCVGGDKTSPKGLVVNDSHAEVVARRSLMRFFYKELLAKLANTSTVFVESDTTGLARIRENLKFHLYISTAPCGDGGLFSREDNHNRAPPLDDIHRPTIENKKQGLLRTKIEGGEGTIPVKENTQQTWDGILHGERMLTMSCSDKILRWNVLGLQGALLSQFMEPVYTSSLTLGSLHHHGHLSRAVCCRARGVNDSLPSSFGVNHPLLGRAQGGDIMERHTEKTSSLSLNWTVGDERAELTEGITGRLERGSHTPRISKASLYSMYATLHMKTKSCRPTTTYSEAKQGALAYQQAKTALFGHFYKKGYGMWVKKPEELEHFKLEDSAMEMD